MPYVSQRQIPIWRKTFPRRPPTSINSAGVRAAELGYASLAGRNHGFPGRSRRRQSHEDTFVSLLHYGGRRSGESRTVCIHGEQHDLCSYWRCNWGVLGFFSSAAGMGPDSRLGVWQSRRFGNRQCGNWGRTIRLLSHVDARSPEPGKIRSDGLHDASEHRAHLSPAYNYYVRTLANPTFDSESRREIMLLRPLFFASFLVHDLLAERAGTGADTIAITSASSKTAIGLAHLLSTHKFGRCHIIGLTSERNLDFARGTGVYDRVVAYDDREILAQVQSLLPISRVNRH